jgi:glutathione S-transferase
MTLKLFAHPFSSYCQKALIAFYENAVAFELKMLDPAEPDNLMELKRLWPIAKFPVLEDDGKVVFEATSIIEYLEMRHPGPVKLIPE